MKVISGSTSSGYGKCAQEGDIIETTFDTVEGKISFKIYWGDQEFDFGMMNQDNWYKDENEEWAFGVTMNNENDMFRIV